jgi:diguanylate cyclase
MTTGSDDFERTIVFGEQAIGHVRSHRTSAYPRIYELWYTFATGHNAALNKAVNAVLARNGTITDHDVEEIHDSYLSPLRFSDRVDMVGARLMGEIDQVMSMVEAAMGQTTMYGEGLRQAVDELAQAVDTREQFRKVVDRVLRVTREMEVSNKILESRLKDSRSEIRTLQEDLNAVRTESLTDPLTSLANRKAFDAALSATILNARETSEPLTLLITDIDHFKRFNDNYGHLTGDQVLRLVALAVKQNVKGADIAARFGGEEFGVVLPNAHLRAGLTVAEHIRRAVMSKELVKRSTGENLGRITISIGVAAFRHDDTATTLIERADSCLYAAKRGGRNRVVCESDPEFELQAEVA